MCGERGGGANGRRMGGRTSVKRTWEMGEDESSASFSMRMRRFVSAASIHVESSNAFIFRSACSYREGKGEGGGGRRRGRHRMLERG